VTLDISRAECNIDVTPGTLTATDTCIGYHVTRFEASRKVSLHTRYIRICVGAGGGRDRRTKIKKVNVYLSSLMMKVPDHIYVLGYTYTCHMYCCYAYRLYFLTCDKYKSSLRHLHDPVLSSLKLKGIRLLFIVFGSVFRQITENAFLFNN
jgi:hypothetical protein